MSRSVVERARGLVGIKFRPQGRSVEFGFDCLGLVLDANSITATVPTYRLRGDHALRLRAALVQHFDEVCASEKRPGDALLLQVCPKQVHLAVYCGGSFIHADARVGHVVETPGEPPWPIISVHRPRFENAS